MLYVVCKCFKINSCRTHTVKVDNFVRVTDWHLLHLNMRLNSNSQMFLFVVVYTYTQKVYYILKTRECGLIVALSFFYSRLRSSFSNRLLTSQFCLTCLFFVKILFNTLIYTLICLMETTNILILNFLILSEIFNSINLPLRKD